MYNNQIFDAIIQVNPIFTESIDASILEYSGQTLPYIWGGDQVRSAANSFSTESTLSIDSLIELIETLLHSPSQKVREFASIGLIEYMQNDSIVPIHVQRYILEKCPPPPGVPGMTLLSSGIWKFPLFLTAANQALHQSP